ncbi:TonB-dependent receptor [Acetobacter tropicalis]|uniref:Membrane protein n=1 Tax=Acetobacter tropicalis TaxID=104102 RepID=A0A252A7D2_9PROT|nr:membrane protein [Acetobacter tropicalis]
MSQSGRFAFQKQKVSLAVALGMTTSFGAGEAFAQDTTPSTNETDSSIKLPAVRVRGEGDAGVAAGNTNSSTLNISRMPASVRDTPQTITVVPHEIIKEQRVFTLDQALANVPGITLSTGEGNGGMNGDQFRIRGLQARQDMYTDGLRDFGTYTRDIFNTEDVQVIKGPTGEYFGAGNVGGVINQSLKHAHAGTDYNYDQAFGSASMYRGAGDVNYQINDDIALRINGMYNRQGVADRKRTTSNRYGTAVDLGVGLHSKTFWHLNWQWFNSDSVPDYGVPFVQMADGVYRPITSHGLARDTSYARSFDRDKNNVHTLTSLLKSEVTRWFTISNDTRLTKYDREYAATTPAACSFANGCAPSFFAGGNPTFPYGAGGGVGYRQDGWAAQNILMGTAKVKTGIVSQEIKAGVDVEYAYDNRHYGTWVNRSNIQTLRDPDYSYPNTRLTFPDTGQRVASSRDVGLFLSDRIKVGKYVSLFGTGRWDSFVSTYNSASVASGLQSQRADRWSPSGSIMVNPLETVSFYFTFARSYKPIGTDVAGTVTNNVNSADVASDTKDFKPQRSDLFEFGSKADFLHKRLGATLSFFRINETNTYYYDTNGDIAVGQGDAGSGRRIQGVELSLTGKITKDWNIYGSYSYLDGKVTHSTTGDNGKQAPQISHNNFSLWTSYDLSRALLNPGWGQLKVAGGAQYASGYWAGPATAQLYRMPYMFNLNGMLSWEMKHYRVSFNANNITNRLNYGSAFSGRTVPSAGRTFIGNIGLTF